MSLHSEIFTLQEKGNRETANKKHSNHTYTGLTYKKILENIKTLRNEIVV